MTQDSDIQNQLTEPMEPTGWKGIKSILPSEFQDALSNNRPARPGVLQTARAYRENPALCSSASKKRLEDIDKEIKALQRERARLADEDSMRTAVVEACATICAPARRLPHDVLHEIAHHALASYPSPSVKDAPMNLSHVSSAWRSVVLHSPLLWATLYLRVQATDNRSIVKYAQAVNAWFRRAGSLPINLYLYVDRNITSDSNDAFNFSLFLKAIAPWAPRVASLGLGGQHWINLMTQFADIEWELSSLHTLEILGQRASDSELIDDDMAKLEAVVQRITMFQASRQKLKTLIANQEITAYLAAFNSFLPWKSLTSVALNERMSSQEGLRNFLLLCPQTHTAFFRRVDLEPNLSTAHEPTPIAKLEQLSLEMTELTVYDLPRFFSAFTFPSLTHLEIDVGEVLISDYVPMGDITSFPSLLFLRLCPAFSTPYIIKFLRNMPKLRTFILDFPGPAAGLDKLFDSMVVNAAQHNLLPALEEFSLLSYYTGTLLDVLTLSRFLCSRTQDLPANYTPFKKLTLMGDISFLSDLHEEVTRISGMTKLPVEINVNPTVRDFGSLKDLQPPDSFFADCDPADCYETLVDHESWLF